MGYIPFSVGYGLYSIWGVLNTLYSLHSSICIVDFIGYFQNIVLEKEA